MRFAGVDASAAAIASASAALAAESRISLSCAALDGRLPFADASVDIVYSHNLLECVPDPEGFARETARVLRPGGRLVVGHWDCDSQLFDGADTALVRRLVHAYADWQQAWMAHADGWMGRRLWGVFGGAGLTEGEVHARVLTNTAYEPGWFGYENAQAFGALARPAARFVVRGRFGYGPELGPTRAGVRWGAVVEGPAPRSAGVDPASPGV